MVKVAFYSVDTNKDVKIDDKEFDTFYELRNRDRSAAKVWLEKCTTPTHQETDWMYWQMEEKIHCIQWFQRIHGIQGITKAWIGFNLMILSLTRVLLALY